VNHGRWPGIDITNNALFITIQTAQLVLQAGSMGEGGDVFVLNMGSQSRSSIWQRACGASEWAQVQERPRGKLADTSRSNMSVAAWWHEELLISSNVEGTQHPLIMRAQEFELPWNILQALRKSWKMHNRSDHIQIKRSTSQAVTEYAPQEIEDLLWRKDRPAIRKMKTV